MSADPYLSGNILACILPRAPTPEQAEAFLRFTPRLALRTRSPGCVFLHFTEAPTPLLLGKVTLTLERLGFSDSSRERVATRMGVGRTAGEALLAALSGRPEGKCLDRALHLEGLQLFLDPFGLEDSPPFLAPALRHLRALGVHTWREFTRLPLQALGSRFGKEGVEMARRMTHTSPELWPRFEAPEKIIETLEMDPDREVPAALEPLLFTLRPLADRICLRLRSRALRLTQLEITLTLRPRGTLSSLFTLSQPQGGLQGLMPLLQEHLRHQIESTLRRQTDPSVEYWAPPEVSGVRLEVQETAPGASAQRDLFDRVDELSENWDSLIGRLQQRLGNHATFLAKPTDQHLPEQGWTSQAPEFTPVNAPNLLGPPPEEPTRPCRLLKRTVPLKVLANPHEPNPHFTRTLEWPTRVGTRLGTRPRRLRIEHIERDVHGPEYLKAPIQAEHRELERLYYRIHCKEGPMLWAFTHERGAFSSLTELQLHGYFD